MANDTAEKSAPAPAKAARAEADDSPKVVKYTGDAGVREITKAQWKGAGVEGQDTTIWDETNDYTLPIGAFSADALTVLERDKQIKVQ
jgi:hypothetical protein